MLHNLNLNNMYMGKKMSISQKLCFLVEVATNFVYETFMRFLDYYPKTKFL